MAESREKIKSRMFRTASKMWGYAENEAETSFDPLVSMLLTACASELVNISHEISESQARVTEKLIELLSPGTLAGVIPAHAVATGRPTESSYLLKPGYQFFFNKKVRSSQKNTEAAGKDIFFSSTLSIPLVDGRIRYMAFDNTFTEIDQDHHKEVLFQAKDKRLPQSCLYLGLELNEKVNPLPGISFYFDFPDASKTRLFFYNLKNSRWHLGDNPLTVTPGYGDSHDVYGDDSLSTGFEKVIDRYSDALRHVNHYYEDHFITIKPGKQQWAAYNKSKKTAPFPAGFDVSFDAQDLDQVNTENIAWLKVEFSTVIDERVMSRLFCAINTFPVINKRFHSSSFKLKKYLNIIPLLTDDFFLDIEKVQDDNGQDFMKKHFDSISNLKPGELLTRAEGMGRFDSRSASQFIGQLLELLRDESASFSIFGREALSKEVHSLNQLISRLEQRVDNVETGHNVTYLLLKSHEDQDILFLDFYTTNGSEANHIKAGSTMKAFVGSEMKEGIRLLKDTQGGRDKLDYEGRVNAYRSSLLSRDKIVTDQDIRAKCLHHFEQRITDVTIKKGYAESLSLKGGFVRTVDIHLQHAGADAEDPEWQQLCKDLSVTLQQQSVSVFPFRFFLNDEMILTDQ